jgi:hypothetical protein
MTGKQICSLYIFTYELYLSASNVCHHTVTQVSYICRKAYAYDNKSDAVTYMTFMRFVVPCEYTTTFS